MQFLVRLIVLASVEVLGLHLAGHFSTDEVRGLKRGGGSGGLGRDRRGMKRYQTGGYGLGKGGEEGKRAWGEYKAG